MVKKLFIAMSVLLVFAIGAFLYHAKCHSEMERTHMMELRQEAEVYEKELKNLRWEYEKMTTPTVDHGTSMVMVGFLTSGSSVELRRIPKKTAYTPMIVATQSILPSALTMPHEWIGAGDQIISNYHLLWPISDTPEKREELKNSGISVCLRSREACAPGMEDSMAVVNYFLIQDPQFSAEESLHWLIDAKQPLLLVFDLAVIPDTTIAQTLEWVQANVDDGNLVYGTVSSAADSMRDYAKRLEAAQAELEVQKAQMNEEMMALQEKIDEIYSHWNEVH